MSDLSRAMREATAYVDRQQGERKRLDKEQEAETPTTASSVRSKPKEVENSPAVIVAYGIAVALAIVAAGVSTQWLVPAMGAGFGIAATIISKGIAPANVDYSWVIPAGAAGVALVGGVAVIFLLMKMVNRAASQPYRAVLPLLAVLAGFCMSLCKDFYPNLPLIRISFGGITCALFVMGGLWWKRYGFLNKLAGTLLILISPVVVLAHGVSGSIDLGLRTALGNVTTQSWIALGGLLALFVVTVLLTFTLGEDINK